MITYYLTLDLNNTQFNTTIFAILRHVYEKMVLSLNFQNYALNTTLKRYFKEIPIIKKCLLKINPPI